MGATRTALAEPEATPPPASHDFSEPEPPTQDPPPVNESENDRQIDDTTPGQEEETRDREDDEHCERADDPRRRLQQTATTVDRRGIPSSVFLLMDYLSHCGLESQGGRGGKPCAPSRRDGEPPDRFVPAKPTIPSAALRPCREAPVTSDLCGATAAGLRRTSSSTKQRARAERSGRGSACGGAEAAPGHWLLRMPCLRPGRSLLGRRGLLLDPTPSSEPTLAFASCNPPTPRTTPDAGDPVARRPAKDAHPGQEGPAVLYDDILRAPTSETQLQRTGASSAASLPQDQRGRWGAARARQQAPLWIPRAPSSLQHQQQQQQEQEEVPLKLSEPASWRGTVRVQSHIECVIRVNRGILL
ncbi:unnamed protein product [Arctogadus glacialis]